jgi:hypothetical protein
MELELSEGRVAGARYHTAKPIFNMDALYGFDDTTWRSMIEWCVNTYGSTPSDGVWTPGSRWYSNNAKFWFRERKDLEWFIIRWQ